MRFEDWIGKPGFYEKIREWAEEIARHELGSCLGSRGARQEVGDVSQDAAASLLADDTPLPTERDFELFTKRALRNKCRDLRRKHAVRGRQLPSDALAAQAAADDVVGAAMKNEDLELLAVAMEQIPRHEREAVTLFYFEGDSYKDGATKMGTNTGTFGAWVSRAKTSIRRIFDA